MLKWLGLLLCHALGGHKGVQQMTEVQKNKKERNTTVGTEGGGGLAVSYVAGLSSLICKVEPISPPLKELDGY